jgi:hypothetical protein
MASLVPYITVGEDARASLLQICAALCGEDDGWIMVAGVGGEGALDALRRAADASSVVGTPMLDGYAWFVVHPETLVVRYALVVEPNLTNPDRVPLEGFVACGGGGPPTRVDAAVLEEGRVVLVPASDDQLEWATV